MNFLADMNCDDIGKKVYEDSTSYVYFSDSEEVKSEETIRIELDEDSISVPKVDIEQSVMALCRARQGKSSVIYSPFYESSYLPYPIIISARKLLFGVKNSSYLIIGGKVQWGKVLKNVYCHGNVGNHALSKYYSFRDISSLAKGGRASNRKSYRNVRWVLSGFFNSDLWKRLERISMVVVDMVTGDTPKLDITDLETILGYSRRHSLPVVFFLKNTMEKVADYLQENGVEILYPPIEQSKPISIFKPQLYSHHTHDDELNEFLTNYNLRSYKIAKNGHNKAIQVRITEDNRYIGEFYQKYLKLSSSIRMFDNNSYGKRVSFFARMLYNNVMEFTGNVDTNQYGRFDWLTRPIGANRVRFSDMVWNLSEPSRNIAMELIDEVDAIMKNFQTELTPKGESLKELLLGYKAQNKTVILLGEESALNGFLRNIFPEESSFIEQLLVAPDQLMNAHPVDIIVLLDPVYGMNKTKLLTSCSSNIIILNYPWQVGVTKKSIEEVKDFLLGRRSSLKEATKETKDKPVDLIEVSFTDSSNQTKQDEKEVLVETHRETSIYDPIFSESNDLFAEDSEEDIDEDFSSLNAISGSNESYELPKWIVPIENKEVEIPENRKIVLVKENRSYLIKAQGLMPGDRILITNDFNPKSLSDFVWEIMERKLGIKRKTHPGNEWREKLKPYLIEHPGTTYTQIFEKLKQIRNIGIMTPTAIYLWLESYDIIGPHDLETLEAIAKLVNSEAKLKDWWEGIQYIRMRHRRIIRHLWKVFAYSVKELKEKSEEDYVVDQNLGIKISEISRLVRFAKITGTPRKVDDNN